MVKILIKFGPKICVQRGDVALYNIPDLVSL